MVKWLKMGWLGRLKVRLPGRGRLVLLAWVSAVVVVGVAAFLGGRYSVPVQTAAKSARTPADPVDLAALRVADVPKDYKERAVATLYNSTFVTREELGEYLIKRHGAERLEHLVNKKIIDMACKARQIEVTDAEIAVQLAEDLKGFNVSEKEFVTVILKKRGQTLYEWKEDVIRPRLALTKYCKDQVKVTEEEILKGFEAKFGPKVECRMLVISKEQAKLKWDIREKCVASEQEFDHYARTQFIQPLAAKKGEIPPIYRNYPEEKIEKEAFSLKPGEVSAFIEMPDGNTVLLRCVKHIARDTTRKLEEERIHLHDAIFQEKLANEIPRTFQKLRERATPKIFLRPDPTPSAGLDLPPTPTLDSRPLGTQGN